MAKFRSWNEELGIFYYFENGRYSIGKDWFDKNSQDRFNWQNAEQFTGLEDKNGKDSFVGDEILINYKGKPQKVHIIFSSGAFKLYDFDKQIYINLFDLLETLEQFEIISNIHEV